MPRKKIAPEEENISTVITEEGIDALAAAEAPAEIHGAENPYEPTLPADEPADVPPPAEPEEPIITDAPPARADPIQLPIVADAPPTLEKSPATRRKKAVSEKAATKNSFFDLDFNALDRNLSPAERQEWNSIYASYRSRSALSGTIIGMDIHAVSVRNQGSGAMERREMFCAIVIPFRVKILIPETEMWYEGDDRPGFVLRNMVGANIDFVVLQVDREGGVAIASRRMAMDSRRYYFTHHPELHKENALVKCNLLSVGPRRCLAECYGYDLNLTQREMRYTAIPDLRTEYSPGQELDCRIKHFDPAQGSLQISVKEVESNPFEGAELRHPVGSRRQAVIAGKYGGGVFCNLPDGTVCMCLYSYQYEDSDFSVGDKVIIIVKQYDNKKQQIYGKIVAKW